MIQLRPFLAAAARGDGVSTWYKLSAGAREWIIILAAIATLTLLLLLWALFFRKHRLLRSHRDSHNWTYPSNGDGGEGNGPARRKRRKWRRRRRDHRPRNPTLAETGGLPPPRSDSPRDPAA